MIYKNNNIISKMYKGSDIVNKINSNIESHTSRLPSGYTEVEYIRQPSSSLRQRVSNKWTIPTTNMVNGDSFTIIFSMDATGQYNTSKYISIFGSDEVFAIRQDSGYGYNLNTKYFTTSSSARGNYTMEYDTKLSFNYKSSLITVTNMVTDVKTLVNLNTTGGYNTDHNLGVFGFWYGGTGEYLMRGNIYEIKIEGTDNTLKYDYIPCKRDSDSKVGLYDIVNNVFSSPSGFTITAGNPVQPTGSTDIVAFQYIVNEQQQPYDAQVEYLESDGASYIDTGLYLNTSNFEIGYECAGNVADIDHAWGYAHQMVGNGAWVSVVHDKAFFGQYTNTVNISSYIVSGDNTIKYTNSGVTVNGTTLSKTFSLSGVDNLNSVSVPIFSWYDFYSRGMEYSQNLKYKSFYLKNNGELVLDMIPVRKDGVGYMYDRVSGQLFANAGTGSFIIGPDV